MTEFLVKRFVKRWEHTEEAAVRTAYGVLSGAVGICCNLLLFAVKAVIGMLMGSVSITADAFNNLSDAGSAIISVVGIKLAERPADEEHPFGHGRIEYIAALVVAFLVIQVGFTFLKDSIVKIMHPEEMSFRLMPFLILILSIAVKLWLGLFNKTLGKRIDSKVMLATSADSMGDAVTTSVTVLSILFWKCTSINIDGFVGLVVSGLVIWAGIGIAKDTLEPLIGEAADPEVFREITEFVESYDGIEGSHDLIVHNYGPGRSMASIHAEVSNQTDIEVSHEVIDKIEKDAMKYKGLFLVIHMDPIETKNEVVLQTNEIVRKVLKEIDGKVSIHDFRMVEGKKQINLIFDMVVPHEYNAEKQNRLKEELKTALRQVDERYQCVIHVEKSYGGSYVFN